MTKIIIFNRFNSNYKIINTKKNINIEELYKKCGFKKSNNFIIIYEWHDGDDTYQLWGKNVGQKYLINNYDLNKINKININSNIKMYGSFLIVRLNNNEYINIDENILFNGNYQNNLCDSITTNTIDTSSTTSIETSQPGSMDSDNVENAINNNSDNELYSSSELHEEEYSELSSSN